MRCVLLVALVAAAACATPPVEPSQGTTDTAPSPAIDSVRAAVAEFYEVSSFDSTRVAVPEDFARPFTADARLVSARSGRVRTVQDYVEIRRGMVESGQVKLLHEEELFGETRVFGRVAHHWSAYAVYVNTTDSTSERGVMDFQLLHDGERWRIFSLTWDRETPENPLPEVF